MMTPCQRHRARERARQALEKHEALSASPTSLHLQLSELTADVARMRASTETREDRTAMKRDELLPKWRPTAQAYLDSGAVHANPVFVYCTIWLFDVGEYSAALDWADIAIAQNQKTPENFSSSFAAFTADTLMAWAQDQLALGYSVEPYFSRVFANVREHWRVHEEIKAKWFKFAAYLQLSDDSGRPALSAITDVARLEEADALMAQAAHFDPTVGVKTMRTRVAARIRALQQN